MTPSVLPRTRLAAAPVALLLLIAAFGFAACGTEEQPLPKTADLTGIGDRPVAERALYLAAYQIGEQIRQQDSTFNVDEFLRGLRAGFEGDSATAVPYVLGFQQGLELQIQARQDTVLTPDLSVYAAGFREGFAGEERRLSRAEEQVVQEQMQLDRLRRDALTNPQAQMYLSQVEASQAAADSFLTANAARDSVQTTESGLQYVVLEEGSGESPEDGDRVLVTYTGTLPDGTVFDSSGGQPQDFEVGEGLIAGMNETLMDMQIGERRRVFIPPSLAYGMQGVPRSPIGPNAVIIFDMTLVDILEPVTEDEGAGTQAPALSQPQVQGQ